MKHEFNKWMASIGNQYYSNDKLMAKAFARLSNEKI
jgi:hypothetical protein|tara:strand:+ start:457 stop:564 length:108 start_codon:yes stop_codon:yes gene_type:complete